MAQGFTKQEKGTLLYYSVGSFDATGLVVNAFSTRKGGVSADRYESLNMSILTSDNNSNVLENRRRLCGCLGIDPGTIVSAHQIHGDSIYKVTRRERGAGSYNAATVIPDTDALMTGERGITLIAFFADCVPLFFLDPVNKVVALAHAGWRGTVKKIAAKTVSALKDNYGTNPAKLLAAVGPSIGPCHYQVDEPVIKMVQEAFPEDWCELFSNWSEDGHAQLDLWQANVKQLCQKGVPVENISVAGMCTYCKQDIFFSHRAGMTGRQAALIMLK